MSRLLAVTIDTEVDKDRTWRIADPPTFRSITEAVVERLTPMFARHGAVPTYLLSPEVIEDDQAAAVLADLGAAAELGTHLHPQFVEPLRTLHVDRMGGRTADDIQCQYGREVEAAKLATLTASFESRFGRRPTSFRAGRYGSSEHTLELLAGLGYTVDSSVTPGLLWRYAEGRVDHRRWSTAPTWVDTPAGSILELPLSIRPGSPVASWLEGGPDLLRRVARRALGDRAAQRWLRPSWGRPEDMVDYLDTADEPVLVCMFHSIEVIAGASPYAEDEAGIERILASLDALLARAVDRGDEVLGLSTIADRLRP